MMKVTISSSSSTTQDVPVSSSLPERVRIHIRATSLKSSVDSGVVHVSTGLLDPEVQELDPWQLECASLSS